MKDFYSADEREDPNEGRDFLYKDEHANGIDDNPENITSALFDLHELSNRLHLFKDKFEIGTDNRGKLDFFGRSLMKAIRKLEGE